MEQKKDLAKIALAALLLASAAPVHAFIDQGIDAQGTYLAAKCGAHGCNTIADDANPNDVYNTRNNSYKVSGQSSDYPAQGYGNNSGKTPSATSTLTEVELLEMLNPQTRIIYLNLDPEGRALAIELANKDSYQDKNVAVKEAERQIKERRSQGNR